MNDNIFKVWDGEMTFTVTCDCFAVVDERIEFYNMDEGGMEMCGLFKSWDNVIYIGKKDLT